MHLKVLNAFERLSVNAQRDDFYRVDNFICAKLVILGSGLLLLLIDGADDAVQVLLGDLFVLLIFHLLQINLL